MEQFERILMTRNDPTFIFQLNVASLLFLSRQNDRPMHYVCSSKRHRTMFEEEE